MLLDIFTRLIYVIISFMVCRALYRLSIPLYSFYWWLRVFSFVSMIFSVSAHIAFVLGSLYYGY